MSKEQKSPKAKEQRQPPGKPTWRVRLLAVILSPVLFLGLVELALSLVGYGYPKDFFIPWKASGQTFYLANSHYCEHFVPKEPLNELRGGGPDPRCPFAAPGRR